MTHRPQPLERIMAQHSLKWSAFQHSPRELAQRQLGVDKASVILGFVAGLPLGLGPVSEALTRWGAPDWLVVGSLVLTVAATTVTGMRLGAWWARHLPKA
jgi:hypothetical protein